MRVNDRRGSVIILVALLMVALLGFGAFAVDLSQMHAYKSELRRTTDAAVLAATLQLLHETQFSDARQVAEQYIAENPVFGDIVDIDSIEYGRHNGADFYQLPCNPSCGTDAIQSSNAIRLRLRGKGTFYLAQLFGQRQYALTARATAWLPVTATPCAVPWAVHESVWTGKYPTFIPTESQLRGWLNTDTRKRFELKASEPSTAALPQWFGAVNLPALTGSSLEHDPNGYLNYVLNIHPGPPWTNLVPPSPHCHVIQPGDLIQGKSGGLDDETIDGLGIGGLRPLCGGFRGGTGDCHNVGDQIGVGVRVAIVRDSVGGACAVPPLYPEDDFGGTAKCFVVTDVRTFVIVSAVLGGTERGSVSGVYAGNDVLGPVRGYAQRPILVE